MIARIVERGAQLKPRRFLVTTAFALIAIATSACGVLFPTPLCRTDGLDATAWQAREESGQRPRLARVREAVRHRTDEVVERATHTSSPSPVVQSDTAEQFLVGGEYTLGGPEHCRSPLHDTPSTYVVQAHVLTLEADQLRITTIQGWTKKARRETGGSEAVNDYSRDYSLKHIEEIALVETGIGPQVKVYTKKPDGNPGDAWMVRVRDGDRAIATAFVNEALRRSRQIP